MIDNTTFNSSNGSVSQFIYGNKIPWTVVFSVQFFLAMIGNPLIVWIVYKDKRLKTTTNYLVVNMAVSDFLGVLLGSPAIIFDINYDNQWLIGGVLGNVMCKLLRLTSYISLAVSLYSCVFIAIDRYYAVAHPMKKVFQNKLKYIIPGIWILPGILSSPRLYFFHTYQNGDKRYCNIPGNIREYYISYDVSFLSLTFALAAPVATIIYTLTVYKLYRHKPPGEQSDHIARRREQQNKKILKMCITIVCLLYLSWSWYFIFFLLYIYKILVFHSMPSLYDTVYSTIFMLYMSFCYNFFIYFIFNNVYRQNIKKIITKCRYQHWYSASPGNTQEMVQMDEIGHTLRTLNSEISC